MPDETSFPMDFPECPHCGCKQTAAQKAIDELRKQDRLPVAVKFPHLRLVSYPLIPIQSATLTLPMCVRYYDICAKCGLERCTRVERQDPPVQMMKQNPDGSITTFSPPRT